MIGWKPRHNAKQSELEDPKGFDDFELRLGDVMRGERATLGKSLLDVQRELRIKATYVAAIENCDPSVFETPGFIAGYVRSYARYLNMDPDETYDAFCAESGFTTAHGMSQAASTIKKPEGAAQSFSRARDDHDFFVQPKLPFAPNTESAFSRIEPGAIGSSLVLLMVIGGIGFGGWSVLQEVQRVQLTPVDQTPVVLSDLDPLQQAGDPRTTEVAELDATDLSDGIGAFNPPTTAALDRLYRPEALDVPVVIARDAPISTLDPSTVGAFANSPALPTIDTNSAVLATLLNGETDTAEPVIRPTGVTLIAAREAWVRVRGDDNSVIYEATMQPGDTWDVPSDLDAPRLTVGAAGALYFSVNGQTFGPAGPRGSVAQDVVLNAQELSTTIAQANIRDDDDLNQVMADMGAVPLPQATPGRPKVLEDAAPGVTIVAVRESWVEVADASGTKLFASLMQPGDTYQVPALAQPPKLFSGNAGALYMAVNGDTYGPVGSNGSLMRNLALAADALTEAYEVADITQDQDLSRVVAELNLARSPATE